jgi:hypothetical protein
MGAWGHGPFENDDAGDWVYELEKSIDRSVIEAAFDAVLAEKIDYLEAPDCSRAIAAAEVTAALLGKPREDLDEELCAWLEGKPQPPAALVAQARAAVAAILAASELKNLWEATAEYPKWQADNAELLGRLAPG